MLHYVSEEDIVTIVQSLQTNLSDQFKESLDNPVMGKNIAHLAMDIVASKLNENDASKLILSGLGGIMEGLGDAMSTIVWNGVIKPGEGSIERKEEKLDLFKLATSYIINFMLQWKMIWRLVLQKRQIEAVTLSALD